MSSPKAGRLMADWATEAEEEEGVEIGDALSDAIAEDLVARSSETVQPSAPAPRGSRPRRKGDDMVVEKKRHSFVEEMNKKLNITEGTPSVGSVTDLRKLIDSGKAKATDIHLPTQVRINRDEVMEKATKNYAGMGEADMVKFFNRAMHAKHEGSVKAKPAEHETQAVTPSQRKDAQATITKTETEVSEPHNQGGKASRKLKVESSRHSRSPSPKKSEEDDYAYDY